MCYKTDLIKENLKSILYINSYKTVFHLVIYYDVTMFIILELSLSEKKKTCFFRFSLCIHLPRRGRCILTCNLWSAHRLRATNWPSARRPRPAPTTAPRSSLWKTPPISSAPCRPPAASTWPTLLSCPRWPTRSPPPWPSRACEAPPSPAALTPPSPPPPVEELWCLPGYFTGLF